MSFKSAKTFEAHAESARGIAGVAVKHLLFRSGSIALARSRRPSPCRLTVLCYHSVSEQADYCGRDISVTPKAFAAQMRYLARHYTVVGLTDAVTKLRTGKPFLSRSVCITFDDGYRDNFDNALPILQANGMQATFFVTADPVLNGVPFWVGRLHQLVMSAANLAPLADRFGMARSNVTSGGYSARRKLIDLVSLTINAEGLNRRVAMIDEVERLIGPARAVETPKRRMMMNVHEMRMLVAAGMTIGAHSLTHPILTKLADAEVSSEVEGSKAALEAALQTPIIHFAYPNGPSDVSNHDGRIEARIAEAGYQSACTSERGMVSIRSDRFALPRQGINARLDTAAFAFKMEEDRFGYLTGLADRIRR